MDHSQTVLYVLAFVLSLIFSGFFAGSETALVALGRIDLQAMRERGDRRGAIIRNLKAHTSRLLAVILIGQNLFLSAASASATTLATGWFGARYGVILSVLFSTITLFIFAEMTPKAIGAASPVAVARAVAIPLNWMMKVLSPLAEVCVRLTNWLLGLFGTPLARPGLTEEELKSVFNLGADEGVIHREEKRLLHKVVEFGDKTVRDIMVPRTKIVALPETASFAAVRVLLREQKLSRLPVYRGSIDNVVGILHAKDLFDLSDADEQTFTLSKYVDPPFLVPEFKRAEELFREMRRRHTHMAIVVDEHGRHGGPGDDRGRHRGPARPDPGRVRRRAARVRRGRRPELPARRKPAPRRPRGAVRHRASARRGRDHRRTPDAALRTHPPQGRALEGPLRRFRHRGRGADRDPQGPHDPSGRAGEEGDLVSPTRTVTLIRGDGIGPEVADAVVSILEAARAPLSFEEVVVGREAEKRDGDPLPPSALDAIRKTGLALKGPVGTPIGKGFQSVNVRLRQTFELYANLRPVRNVPSVESRFQGVDLVIVRENTEDLYSGLEHIVVPGVVESLKIITEAASTRIARFAFEYARANGRRRVTAVHKANIMKLSDGLFLDCFRRVAEGFPDIVADDRIVDALCMRLVMQPETLDVLLLENLYGDIVSDLAAGLVGGLGVVPGANLGTKAAIFEAVHGTAPDIAGQDKANPTALLMSAILMLRHLDLRGPRRSGRGGDARNAAGRDQDAGSGRAGRDEGVREGDCRAALTPGQYISTFGIMSARTAQLPSTFAWQPSRRPSPMS